MENNNFHCTQQLEGAPMAITTDMIKTLRTKTGAGIMDSKRALEETDGNIDKAVDFLRQQGLAKAGKKADRAARQGLIDTYIHAQGRIGAMVEVNCETDFVARTEDFKRLAYDISMQVAAMAPRYATVNEIKEEDYAALEREFGDRDAAIKAVVLSEQTFIKDAKKTISDMVKENISKLGENIVIRRFARFELGETSSDESTGDA
ncbi:MAG TPA: translation elongation factor Ts [Thermomicrobiales bacterium]|nr:translation elongation factor Ts [Thermomicrobiales bacterium]